MEWSTFSLHVASAVGHLEDRDLLREHPLASFLFPDLPPDDRNRELERLLRAAIGELRPTDVTESNLGALRRYQYLDLRYLQGRRAAHVAQELGLSDRQARRIHGEAIEALARVVWSSRRRTSDSAQVPVVVSQPELVAVPTSEWDADVSRLGATPSVEGASLSEVLRSALATVGPLAARHGVEVDVASIPPLPLIAIDRTVLRQVLVNLLVAAIETDVHHLEVDARPGPDTVDVSFTTHFSSASVGQPHDALQHDELLRVVRRLVQLQAGGVEVRVVDSTSSIVVLALPAVQLATILLVDDNPDTLRLFRRYLAGGSFRPIEAADGRQAIDLARQAKPRAIVLDVMLPSQDGWEILQALRNDLVTQHIPVVMCSVLRQNDLAEALGASAYLAKPITRDALLVALRRVLALQRPSPIQFGRIGSARPPIARRVE